MLLHRHCVFAAETAISVNHTKSVFPKAGNVGQLHVAHTATGTPFCFPPMMHAAEAKHWTRTHDNHTKVVSQQRAKRKAVLQTEWGIAHHTAFSPEPRVTSAGTRTAAHRAAFIERNETSPARRPPAALTANTPKASIWTALCANTHTTTNDSERSTRTQEASRQTVGTPYQNRAAEKQQLWLCQEERITVSTAER